MAAKLFGLMLAGAVVCGPVSAGEGCKCRANGQAFEQGMLMCIRGALSRCSMNQNVPTWAKLSDTCPESRLQSPRLERQASLPPKSSAY